MQKHLQESVVPVVPMYSQVFEPVSVLVAMHLLAVVDSL